MARPPLISYARRGGCGHCLKDWSHVVFGFLACGFLAVLLFSRSLYPCLLGAVGLLVSIETIAAVDRNDQRMLPWYGAYMAVNVVASLGLGVVTLTNVDAACAGAQNPDTCAAVGSVTGVVVSVGSSTLGLLAIFASLLPLCSIRCCAGRGAGDEGGGGGGGAALLRAPLELHKALEAGKLGL